MKKRVLFDGLHMFALMALTIVLLFNKGLYAQNRFADNVMDFFGLMLIFDGVMLRMSARAHKAALSDSGGNLVTTGPYRVVRNPMYLGSFLLGCGFASLLWPWWALPVFIFAFYWRFDRTIAGEEEFLRGLFGSGYEAYCDDVPRLIPNFNSMQDLKPRDIIDFKKAFATKEARYVLVWPLVAFIFECLQEWFIYGSIPLQATARIFVAAILLYGAGCLLLYRMK